MAGSCEKAETGPREHDVSSIGRTLLETCISYFGIDIVETQHDSFEILKMMVDQTRTHPTQSALAETAFIPQP